MGEFELLVAQEDKIQKRGDEKKQNHFLEISDCQETDARKTNSSMKNFSTTRSFSMPTLMEEIKPAVSVKYEFEYREEIKLECFLRKYRTIRILMQKKNNEF